MRWQTQDADGALLRDQLRQAARTWERTGRIHDLPVDGIGLSRVRPVARALSGRAHRARGGLRLGHDVARHPPATKESNRYAAAAFAVLLAVLVVVGALWQRSIQQTRRAEAANLLALGQLRLGDYPTATLAHAIASLELSDTAEARRLALRALWEGPTAITVNEDDSSQVGFAGDGDWLVQGIQTFRQGATSCCLQGRVKQPDSNVSTLAAGPLGTNPEGSVLYSAPIVETGTPKNAVLWSLPDGRRISETWFEPPAHLWSWVRGWSWNSGGC